MKYAVAVCIGRIISYISRLLHLGAGATWAGEIALCIDPAILRTLQRKLIKGSIFIIGTNGKTTTSLLIQNILTQGGYTVIHNSSGANLLNGVVSSLLLSGKKDWGIFEIDENALSQVTEFMHPSIVVMLNLFRDQLDRYGEIDTIAKKWNTSLHPLSNKTQIIANADDPLIVWVAEQTVCKKIYFGIEDPSLYSSKIEHATDTLYCPKCGTRLTYGGIYYSHLGKWSCGTCGFTHPDVLITKSMYTPLLEGTYNIYNTLAAATVGEVVTINTTRIQQAIQNFTPAFGRMEEIQVRGKKVRIVLSKNPTGFNESIRTYIRSKATGPVLLLLNDRIPDGKDVSWIWDVDFEMLQSINASFIVSGDRVYDLAVRLKYALTSTSSLLVTPNLIHAIDVAFNQVKTNETLWILTTYSAMLETRKILKGKKIL